ncbi:transmembrane protein C1orf162 homolog isoform X2 [Vulpes vulpes]|uniref:Transmembrane protein C1orf162 homolog isoform X2 n=1 Tax=Vulpes vulpes TaxID=9627 RepID=A0ABM5B693_VULVU
MLVLGFAFCCLRPGPDTVCLCRGAHQILERAAGGGPSPSPTVATVAAAPTAPQHTAIQHLAFAFLAGVLLTLLLLALVFFIVKCCRKCHSSPWALDPPLDPHSSHDPPAKLSSPEGALTYAKVTFKISEETNNHLTEKHSANLDPVVYAQVKVTDSPYLSNEA